MFNQKIFTHIVRLSFVDLRWAQLYVSLVDWFESMIDILKWPLQPEVKLSDFCKGGSQNFFFTDCDVRQKRVYSWVNFFWFFKMIIDISTMSWPPEVKPSAICKIGRRILLVCFQSLKRVVDSKDESSSATSENIGNTPGGVEQDGLLQLLDRRHQGRAG